MELKGSKTEANLQAAFAGESMATNKYTYFASKAKKDGYQQIAAIFEETAANEREHAKMWYKLINGGIDSTLGTLDMRQRAKTTSGQICTKISLKLPRKKALQSRLLLYLKG